MAAAATAAGTDFKWCRVCDALRLSRFECTNREYRMRHTWAVRPKAVHELSVSVSVKRERADAGADDGAGAGAAGAAGGAEEPPAMRAVPALLGAVKTEAAEEMETGA